MNQAAEDLLVRIDATTEQLRRELAKADQLVAGSASKMDRHLARVDKRFDALNRAAGFASKAIVGYLGVLSVGSLVRFANQQLALADALGKAAEVADLTTDSLQELRYTFTSLAQLTDGQVDASLRRFGRRLGLARQEAGPAKAAFDQLFGGVRQFGSTEQALDAVIDRLAGIEDQAKRAALASAFFGDDAGPLLAAALGKGAAAIQQMRRDAHDLGLVLDRDLIENAGQIRDDFDKTQRILSTAFMRALNTAAPLLIKMAEMAERIARAFVPTQLATLQRELEDLRKRRDDLLKDLDRPRLLRINPFVSTEELQSQLNAINDQLLQKQRERNALLTNQPAPPAGQAASIGQADPEALAELRQQVADQRALNEALLQGADAYRRVRDEIERRNAAQGFAAELAQQEHLTAGPLVAQYREQYAALQELRIAQEEFNAAAEEAARIKESLLTREQRYDQQLEMLDSLLERGLLTWEEYARAVAGATNELESFRAVSTDATLNDLRLAVEGFGRAFEDAIVSAAKTGQLSFKDMANAILEDLLRIVIRAQVIRPLLTGLGARFPGLNLTTNADGNAFRAGRVIPFARGGVVTGPTLFPMAGNQTGLMGEAGPEAIMPLRRGPDGKLGVEAAGVGGSSTVVQIIDQRQGGEPPQVEESRGPHGQQLIRVLIRDEVQAAISGGAFDRTFANTYGLRRRGF